MPLLKSIMLLYVKVSDELYGSLTWLRVEGLIMVSVYQLSFFLQETVSFCV